MKAKFNKLDKSKLSKEVNAILDKIKKATDNFKKEDKKAEALFDRLYDKIAKGKPEAIKSTKKPSVKKKKASGGNRGVFTKLAKSIRDDKPSMTWKQAMSEASEQLKKGKDEENKKFTDSIQTLMMKNKAYFGSSSASSLLKDAKQPAKPIGARISKKSGKKYYEYRTNRTDVKQPPKSFPMLEKGGDVNRGSFNVEITLKDGRGANILPIDVSKKDAQDIADMINNMKPMSAKADVSLPFAKGGIPKGYHKMPNGEIMKNSDHLAKGGLMDADTPLDYAKGGEIKIYVDEDDEPIKVVKGLNNAKKWVLKNKRYHDKIVVEDEALDSIVVDKTDTIKDIDWLFNPTYAKGGSIKVGDKVKYPKGKISGKVKSIKDLGWERELTIEYDDGKIIKEGESSVIKFAKGGRTQGYNDKLDESLGKRKGKESTKQQSKKDRRNESKGMEKGSGRRAYSSVSTMDVGDRMMAKGGNVPKRFLDEKGERKNDPETIKELTKYVMSLPQTKKSHYNKTTEKYSPKRQKLHREIINKFKGDLVCIESDEPIAILMGGSPASGKSTFLKKYAPYLLKEELLRIDADEVRAMLPEYKGWNASATHNETQDIVKTLLSDRTIGVPCKYDLIFDGTMTSPKKYLDLIKLLKKIGYKVFVVFIDKVPKDVIMKRAMDRYKKSGRFVPPFVIEEFFESGKDSLAKVKSKVDGYMIVDGSDSNYKVSEQKGLKLPKTRKYGRLGVPLKKSIKRKK